MKGKKRGEEKLKEIYTGKGPLAPKVDPASSPPMYALVTGATTSTLLFKCRLLYPTLAGPPSGANRGGACAGSPSLPTRAGARSARSGLSRGAIVRAEPRRRAIPEHLFAILNLLWPMSCWQRSLSNTSSDGAMSTGLRVQNRQRLLNDTKNQKPWSLQKLKNQKLSQILII